MSPQVVSIQEVHRIAVIVVHNPPVNTMNAAVRQGLREAIAEVRRRQAAAVVIACDGKTFISGAEIGEFSGPPMEADYREVFGQLESLSVPVIATMHGAIMGAGLELALACHYRVTDRDSRMGLPELTLGIIPGAGGTQRMPRLIGVEKTLEMLFSGQPVDSQRAKALGIVDAIADEPVRDFAIAYAEALVAADIGPRRTSERSVDPATATPEILARLGAEAKKRFPNRTSASLAVEAVGAAAALQFDAGLLFEEELVNRAKRSPECRALVHLFFAERATRKLRALPEAAARPVNAAGIIGAGTMGGGIAMCFANAGLPVTIVDSSESALARGLAVIEKNYQSMVDRGRLSADDKARRMALIKGSLDYAELASGDLIVEAVYEDMALKRKIFAAIDAIARPGAVLATNTSTLDVTEIARATQRAQDVVGLHFFSPANVMPLLEVVRTDVTAPEVVRTAFDLATRIKKIPVLSAVCYGFIGNRMMEGYAREAERMLLEGATPSRVDGVLEGFGMAMGILAVFDMAGVEVNVNVHKANADRYPPDPTYNQAEVALHAAGRLGQKNGKGFYAYVPGDRNRHEDPEALAILRDAARRLGVAQRDHSEREILERCLYPLINEGLRILQEGIARCASDIDVVWTSGYGFPRYRGGPLFYAETIGFDRVLSGIHQYRDLFGPMHWTPAPLLEELVRDKKTLREWEADNR